MRSDLMRKSFGLATKLGLCAAAFLLPIGVLLALLVMNQNADIGFVTQEVAGVRYLRALIPLQSEAATAATSTAQKLPATVAQALRDAEAAFGLTLDTAAAASASIAASSATHDAESLATARAKLRDLIVRIGDRSNLILDNVLDSYYLTDAVLNRLPDLVDRAADLAARTRETTRDTAWEFRLSAEIGSLETTLDGFASSIASAAGANQDGSLQRALGAETEALKNAITSETAALNADHKAVIDGAATVAQIERLQRHAAGELERLLVTRADSLRRIQLIEIGTTLGLFLAAVCLVLWIVVRGITRPLGALTAATVRMADGDLDTVVPARLGDDEVAHLARAVTDFQAALQRSREQAALHAEASRLQLERYEATTALARDFNEAVGGQLSAVAEAADALRGTALGLSERAERTSERTGIVQQQAELATQNASLVAAATEQLAASSQEIGSQVERSAAAMRNVASQAGAARALVDDLTRVVIGTTEVVDFITGIAGQTNLLALNATIEAARAGEAGKGFAVVASEVKNLANQTAKATGDIAARIEAVRQSASRAADVISSVADMVGDVDSSGSAIAAAVSEQGAATDEISRNVQEAAQCTGAVSDSLGTVRVDAQETRVVSNTLLSSASDLSTKAERLRTDIHEFLRAMGEASDRRLFQRYTVRLAVEVGVAGAPPVAAEVTDLSPVGAALLTRVNARPGDEVVVTGIVAPPVTGRVVVCENGVLRLQFRPDPVTRSALDDFIQAQVVKRAA